MIDEVGKQDWPMSTPRKKIVRHANKGKGENMVIQCYCGTRLEITDPWATECPQCGREYNRGGQLLAPRSQGGEETGETFT